MEDTTTSTNASGSIKAENQEKSSFKETATRLGATLTRGTLTPVVGLGLICVAAHDAISSGIIGTMHKAQDLICQTEKNVVDLKGAEVGSIDESAAFKKDGSSHPEAIPVQIFHIEDANWKQLRKQFVDKGIPFILRRKDGAAISNARPPQEPDPNEPAGNISVSFDSLTTKYGKIDDIIKKVLPYTFRPHWPLWFQGNYKSGLAHIDLGPGTINFYCLQRGKKDVVIADYEVTRELHLKTGIDNLHIPGSSGNHDYLERLSKYYRITLEENSILVFNNSGCLHHFTNMSQEGIAPIALSVRCKHSLGSDPRGWLHLATDLKVWWNMTDHLIAMSKHKLDSRPQEKA